MQAALKASGGSQFTVHASSPDLAKAHAKAPVTQTSPMHDTTFSTGTGERVDDARWVRGRGKMVVAGVIAVAAIGGGMFWWQSGASAEQAADQGRARRRPSRSRRRRRRRAAGRARDAAQAPVAKTVQQVKKVELRLASVPAGAKVVDNVDGELLGVTPLVLTRPRGGTLTLRFEKDGYNASTRTMPLDGDRAFELTLEAEGQEARAQDAARPRPVELGAGETVTRRWFGRARAFR